MKASGVGPGMVMLIVISTSWVGLGESRHDPNSGRRRRSPCQEHVLAVALATSAVLVQQLLVEMPAADSGAQLFQAWLGRHPGTPVLLDVSP